MSDDPKLRAHDPRQAAAESQGYEVAQIDPKSDFEIKWVDYVDGGNQRRLYGELRAFGPTASVRLVVQQSDRYPERWQWSITGFESDRVVNLKRENVESAEVAQAQCEEAFRNWVKLEDRFQDQERSSAEERFNASPGADGPGSA